MNVSDKKKLVDDFHERFIKSKVVILTDYKGINVTTVNTLRKELREVDVEYSVVKNTLLKRASESTNVEPLKEFFKGPSGVAISYEDPVAPAKVLTKFAEDNKKFEIKIGVMEGKVLDINSIIALSKLPSREVLLGQVLSAMNGVPTAFVRVLNNISVSLLNVLCAIRDKKENS